MQPTKKGQRIGATEQLRPFSAENNQNQTKKALNMGGGEGGGEGGGGRRAGEGGGGRGRAGEGEGGRGGGGHFP